MSKEGHRIDSENIRTILKLKEAMPKKWGRAVTDRIFGQLQALYRQFLPYCQADLRVVEKHA